MSIQWIQCRVVIWRDEDENVIVIKRLEGSFMEYSSRFPNRKPDNESRVLLGFGILIACEIN